MNGSPTEGGSLRVIMKYFESAKVPPQIIHNKQKALVIKLLDSRRRVLRPIRSSTIYDQTPMYRVSPTKKKGEKSNLKTDDMEKHDISILRPFKFCD